MNATVSKDGMTLTVEIPISPRPSASGKSLVIASSSGNKATTATHDGKPIIVGFNAYVTR